MASFKIQLSHGVSGLRQDCNGNHSVVIPESGEIGISGIADHGLTTADIVHVAIAKEGTTPSKLGGAAAGAALGFLLAGPLGTAVGGLAGSNRQGQDTLGSIVFSNGATLVVTVDASNMSAFLSLQARYPLSGNMGSPTSEGLSDTGEAGSSKECPRCAETIKLKAIVCRFCGHEFSQSEVDEAVREATDIAERAMTERLEKDALEKALPKDVYLLQIPTNLVDAKNAVDALINGLKPKHPKLVDYAKIHLIKGVLRGDIRIAEQVSLECTEELKSAIGGFGILRTENVEGDPAPESYDVRLQITNKTAAEPAIDMLNSMGVDAALSASIAQSATPGLFGLLRDAIVEENVDKQRSDAWQNAAADLEFVEIQSVRIEANSQKDKLLLNSYLSSK